MSTRHDAAPSLGASGIRRPYWAMVMPLPDGRDASPAACSAAGSRCPSRRRAGLLKTLLPDVCAVSRHRCVCLCSFALCRSSDHPVRYTVHPSTCRTAIWDVLPLPSGGPSTGDGHPLLTSTRPPCRPSACPARPVPRLLSDTGTTTFVGPGLSSRSPPGALPYRENPTSHARPFLAARFCRCGGPETLNHGD